MGAETTNDEPVFVPVVDVAGDYAGLAHGMMNRRKRKRTAREAGYDRRRAADG